MRRYSRAIALSLLVFALFYAALWDSGFTRLHWTIAIVAVALAGIVRFAPAARHNSSPPRRQASAPALPPAIAWPILLLPCYVSWQLVPLPLALLRLLSPERAHSLEALGQIMPPVRFAAISANSAATWENLVRITGYLAVIVLIRELSWRSAARGWKLAWPIITLAACEAALGLTQMVGVPAEARSEIVNRGTYLNRDHYSALLEMALPFAVMAVFAALRSQADSGPFTIARVLQAALPAAAALLLVLGIFGSLSRIGPVAAGAAVFVALMTGLARRLPALGKAALATGAGVVILAGFLYLAPAELIERYETTDSSEPRWGIWRDSLHLAAHYPATGSGLGTFYDAFQPYQTSDVSHAYPYAHNDYLQVLGELGIPGFLIVAVLIGGIAFRTVGVAGRAGEPQTRFLALACLGAMAALLVHSFVDFIAYAPADALVFAWILGLAAGLPLTGDHKQPALPERRLGTLFFRRITLAASAFLLVYGAAWLVFDTRLRAYPTLERALCHAGLCDNDGLAQRAVQSLNSQAAPSVVAAGFHQALRRTPNAPLLWCEMGEAERRAGQLDQAKFCYGQAHALAPNNPFILWQLVTAEIILGDMRQGFAYASDVLRHTRLFDQTVFGFFTSMKTSVPVFLSDILPENAEAAGSYLRFLIQHGNVTGAVAVWDRILPRGYSDAALANEYVAFLLHVAHPDLAARAWSGYLGNRAGDFRRTNALFNGDFELPPTGSLLDWTILPVNGAKATFDSAVRFSGNRALRICFDGADFNFFDHVWQVFAIDPGVYQVEAQVRSQNLYPGIQLRIVSWPEEGALRVLTEAAPDSTEWKPILAQFTAPQNVAVARIDVMHQAAVLADQKMGGCAWIDAVRLERVR